MTRVSRPGLTVFGFAVLGLLVVTPPTRPRAQTPAASVTPAQAAAFMGDWLLSVAMGANEATFALSIKDDGGKVVATLSADGQAPTTVTNPSLAGNNLVLKYVATFGNNAINTVMTLTPDGSTLRVSMSVMDGQYELSGSGTKAVPGQPMRAMGFGRGGSAPTNELTDFSPKPPYTARTPAEEAAGFMLPAGYRAELVAAEPEVISPVAIEFDGNGRMYVAEMISYMMDAEATREHEPISRISRWESSKGDGKYDRRTIFADRLTAPRMILPLTDGVILTSETDSDDLIKLSDTNGDGVADKREVVFTGIGQSGGVNIEHQKSGLVWNLDNWIYTTYNPFRLRWTPAGFLREPTAPNAGQWGLATDDDGKPWFVDAGGERGPMNFQYPIHYGAFTPCPPMGRGRGGPPPAPNPNCPAGMENGFEKDFAVVWPAPGIGDMQGGIQRTRMPMQNLNHFTAATGPAIFRGDALPSDLRGHLLFAEPVGRLIRRAATDNIEGLTQLRNVYPGSEFMTSADQLFRPVNISNAPDGTLYVADMYHGIIQEREWSGPGSYLRAKIEQYQLDKINAHGRIWRLRYDGRPAVAATTTNPGQPAIEALQPKFTAPKMYSETPAQLVAHLTNANGWWRDTAQRLLILKQDKSVVPALQQLARATEPSSPSPAETSGGGGARLLARFHALWTLEGLGALDAKLVREGMKDANPRMRIQAIRASETLYKAGDKSLADDYRALTKDADPNVVIQAMLTANLFKLSDASDVIKAAQAGSKARGVALVGERLLAVLSAPATTSIRRGSLSPEDEKRLQAGSDVYAAVCSACHGEDGTGRALQGAAPGTMMAPSLAGSPRVQAHRDYVIKVILGGLTGPLDGKTYRDVMAPMGQNDEWVAGVASFVRTSFGNAGTLVTPADVARVRASTSARKAMWTVDELEASLPRALESRQWKVTASHASDAAVGGATLRGWSSGGPQIPGMWFAVELPQPAMLTELQFGSAAINDGRGRGGAPAAPVIGFPRGYSVHTSMDGTTWSKPVAEGKGEGARTTITFPPTRAKFIRITQTETVSGAPPWSIRNLRLYEAARPQASK
jgi:mono/diheme cytochrome c family protein